MQKFVEEKNNPSYSDGEILIGEHFKLYSKNKLGSGAFGDIYKGLNKKLNEHVAIKLEPIKSQHPQIFSEYKVYNILQGTGLYYIINQLEYLQYFGQELKEIII